LTDQEIADSFKEVGEVLLNMASESDIPDAMCRTSIGRYYYSVFWCARAYVRKTEPARLRENSTHDDLWRAFRGDADHQRVEVLGRRLHDLRIKADYKELGINPMGFTKAAKKVCGNAHDAIAVLLTRVPN
jgi:hypothetical protein